MPAEELEDVLMYPNRIDENNPLVRELQGEIEIETDDKNLSSIRSGSSFFKIHGLAADEFPPLPKFKPKSPASAMC